MWLLRRRGLGVVGEAVDYLNPYAKGAPMWPFPMLTFTTVDGRRMDRVTSVASASMWSLDRDFGSPIDVLYDPERGLSGPAGRSPRVFC